jgi:dynein heavy chain
VSFYCRYRQALRELWLERLVQETVPHTEAATLVHTLSEPVLIREWQLRGLPRDALSVENACVVRFSARWPLFIDPQV